MEKLRPPFEKGQAAGSAPRGAPAAVHPQCGWASGQCRLAGPPQPLSPSPPLPLISSASQPLNPSASHLLFPSAPQPLSPSSPHPLSPSPPLPLSPSAAAPGSQHNRSLAAPQGASPKCSPRESEALLRSFRWEWRGLEGQGADLSVLCLFDGTMGVRTLPVVGS